MPHHRSKTELKIPNRLLEALPKGEYERIFAKLESVSLPLKSAIYQAGEKIESVFFPEVGIISLLATIDNSSTLEVGIVGREGMVGLPLIMGVDRSRVRAVVQGTGSAMRMSANDFEVEGRLDGTLRRVVLRYTHSLIAQISQSAVCFRFHAIELRLARWLLMTSDRLESTELQMTQEFLSNMLGVRREAVNRAARSIQTRGLISYSRSTILIIDRPGLVAASCDCYAILRDEEASTMRSIKSI